MDEKQLEFLNSIAKIDWAQQATVELRERTASMPVTAQKLSKGQRKRMKKHKKSSGPNTAALKNVETVVFENPDATSTIDSYDPKAKKRGVPGEPESADKEEDEFDMRKARFEMIKFGINAMSGTEKYDAETALALSLGAKPEKRKCINYKDLQVVRKEQKQKTLEDEARFSKPGVSKKPVLKNKSGRPHDGITRVKHPDSKHKQSSKFRKPRK